MFCRASSSGMKAAVCLLTMLPALAQVSIEDKERAIGQQYASEIRRQSKPFQHPDVVTYVHRVANQLAARLPSPPTDFTVEVISGSEHKEPVVFRPGYLFVPIAFLAGVEDEAEFTGMLAHVIAHLAIPPARLRTSSANTASIPLIAMGPVHLHPGSASAVLLPQAMLAKQRDIELETDRIAVRLAAEAGYDTTGLRRYLARMKVDEDRLTRLDQASRPIDSSEAFQRAKAAAVDELPKRRPPTLRRRPSLLR